VISSIGSIGPTDTDAVACFSVSIRKWAIILVVWSFVVCLDTV
jgi:hypothetical protein